MTSVLRRNANLDAQQRATTGDLKMSAVASDHLGWLLCNGRSLDKTTYNLLFQVIGYLHGGSGNTFNLPNPAGRVIVPTGTVTDVNGHTLSLTHGQTLGEIDHQLTVPELAAHSHDMATGTPGANTFTAGTTSAAGGHSHTITDPGHVHSYTRPANEQISAQVSTQTHSSAATTDTTVSSTTGISINAVGDHTHTIASNGQNAFHNTIQPTLAYGNSFIYCGIPTMGKYPFTTGLAPVLI